MSGITQDIKALIVTDLDGTMLPPSKLIPPEELEAIRGFEQRGGIFTVATGRALHAAERYFDELNLSVPMILYNGCVIYDTRLGKPVHEEFLPHDEAYELTRRVSERFPDMGVEILRRDGVYVPKINPVEEAHIEVCRTVPIMRPFDMVPRGEWYKVLFALRPEQMTELTDFIGGIEGLTLQKVASERHFYELLPPGVSKGSALKKLITLLPQSYKVYAAGDYNNDIEMLRAADFGVATANALDAVKAEADIILDADCAHLPMTELINRIYKSAE